MEIITLEMLKSIKDFKDEQIGILFEDKDTVESVIEHYSPDYFEHSYRYRNTGKYLMIFTNSWITNEDIFLVYDLDAKFKYLDVNEGEDEYAMELTEENILKWINEEHDVSNLVLFKKD